jgi:NitT/TauT family transport system substrate-binding protein
MLHRRFILAVAAVTLTSGLAACSSGSAGTSAGPASSAGPADPTTVTLAIANINTQTYLSIVLAEQLGYFKQQGVDVKITNVATSTLAWSAMLSGETEGVAGLYDHNIDLQTKGKSTEAVIQLNQAPGFVEMVRTAEAGTITSPAQLVNKNIGVNGLGSSNQFIADYLAVHSGVPISKVHAVSVNAGTPFVKAMQTGQIDAGIITEPSISQLLEQKAGKIIVDMRSVSGTQAAVGGPYPGTALTFPTAWVNSHPATVQKIVNALVKGLDYIQQHSAAQITAQIPPSYYAGTGEQPYIEALANEIGIFSPTGLMPTDGSETVLKVLTAADPSLKGKTVNLAATYTEQFVQNATP